MTMHDPASIDETNDPALLSWVESAQNHPEFPIQNLPLGRFHLGDGLGRTGIRLGDSVIDLAALADLGLLEGDALLAARAAIAEPVALNRAQRTALRRAVSALFSIAGGDKCRAHATKVLRGATACTMMLPARIGDYTDFNAGIHHVLNGRKMRGNDAGTLSPNFHHVPMAYHCRASSVVPTGTPVRRPLGQTIEAGAARPTLGPTRKLDIELELGIWISRANPLGARVSIDEADEWIAGYCLLNDWSTRDVMAWEMDRLGPFLGKSFATTISPWMVSPEALAPYRIPAFQRASKDHLPLPYLLGERDQASGALSIQMEIHMRTQRQRDRNEAAERLTRSNTSYLYWTPAQMIAHHATNGCNLQPGDLLGTGTVSGAERSGFGCFRELGMNGTTPFQVGGETRYWAEDGDEVILRAHASKDGFKPIGFGDCAGVVLPAQT